MHVIIQGFGLLIVIGGGALMYFAGKTAGEAAGGTMISVLVMATALGLIVSGAAIYCFGAIVQHLIAIRRISEAQMRLLAERLGTR